MKIGKNKECLNKLMNARKTKKKFRKTKNILKNNMKNEGNAETLNKYLKNKLKLENKECLNILKNMLEKLINY